VRATLRVLEDKGHVRHEQDGPRYVFLPTVARSTARSSALSHLVRTFFGGSTAGAMAALLDLDEAPPEPEELDALAELIERARREGR
jgi:predicted transcriptional regulator